MSKKAGLPEIIIIRLVIVWVINWAKQELMEWALLAPSTGLSALLSWLFFLPWVISTFVSVSLPAGAVSTYRAQASSCSLS